MSQRRRYFLLRSAFNSQGALVVVIRGHSRFIVAETDMVRVRRHLLELSAAEQRARPHHFLPDSIRLPYYSETRTVSYPQSLVLDPYDRRNNWEKIMGRDYDGTTRAIVMACW